MSPLLVPENPRTERWRQFVNGTPFTAFITTVILFNAVLIGIDTYPVSPSTERFLKLAEWVCVGIYVVEILLKLVLARRVTDYVRDPWNVFDLAIVAAAFLPLTNGMSPVLRLLRVIRVLRIINVIPELKLIVTVLFRSVTSMAYIALLMGIVFYIYAVMGVMLYGQSQPNEYGTLHEAFFSLFRSMTVEDWTDLRYEGIAAGESYWGVTFFHVSWVLISTFIILNLIVGAIINNFHAVQQRRVIDRMTAAERDARLMELFEEVKLLMDARKTS